MGVQKKTRKFAEVKRVIGKRDGRRKENIKKAEEAIEKRKKERAGPDGQDLVREIPQMPSSFFFSHNTSLVPPYDVLLDTSFITRAVNFKLEIMETMMDCLYAACNPIITGCVIAELERLGNKFKIAMRVAKDERFTKRPCHHAGVYADDCLTSIVSKNQVYIVASNDRGLQQRLRKIPGVPIMKAARGKFLIERLPGAVE